MGYKNPGALTMVICFCLCVCLSLPLFSLEDEYLMKSFYFRSFSNYITWPASTGINDSNQQFYIGIIGEDPFGATIEKVYIKNKINEKKVIIRRLKELSDIEGCHILFISQSEEERLGEILSITRNKPILTVGDTPGYAHKGVHINFYIDRNKVRFEINIEAVRQSPISINTKLLEIARIVKSSDNMGEK